MPNWKKVIVSGSNAILSNITASGDISASGDIYATNFYGTIDSASHASTVLIQETNTPSFFSVLFSNSDDLYRDDVYGDFVYNPSTNTLRVDNLEGTASLTLTSSYILGSNVDGAVDLANTANVATSASYLNAVLSTTDFNYPVPFTEGSNNPDYYTRIYNDSKGHFTYNPSTNTLRVGGIIQLSGSIDFKNNNGDLVISGSDTLDMPVGAAGSLNIFTSSIFDFNLANNAQNIDIGINNASAVNLGANSSITTVYNLTAAGSNIRAINLPLNTVDADSVVMWKSSTGYFYYTASSAFGGSQNLQEVTEQGSSTTIPITASIISASGTIIAEQLTSTDDAYITDTLTAGKLQTISGSVFGLFGVVGEYESLFYDRARFLASITASNDISASGDIYGRNLIIDGNITAEQYIINSTVTNVTMSFSSGSTIFGDSLDDTHLFTGSVDITGSLTVDGITYPTTDGTIGQVLTTDGAGNLTFTNTTTAITASAISASYIDLTPLANGDIPAHKEGRIFFGQEDGALEVYNDEADITLQVGQEFWVRAKNNSGGDILNGTPVRISGSQGDRVAIFPALAEDATDPNHDPFENHVIGVATHDILDTEEGYITVQGIVRGVDTSGFNAGDILYLQTGSVGFRNSPPPFPYEAVIVGIATKINGSNGFIFVEPREPVELERITGISGSVYSAPIGSLLVKTLDGGLSYSKTLSGSYAIDNGDLDVDGNITASGNISASGYVSADHLILNVTSSLSGSEDPYFISFNGNENYKEGVLKRTFDKTNLNPGDPGYDLRGEQICSVSTDIAIIEAQYRIMIYGCTVSDSGGPYLLEATSSIASAISFNPNSSINITPAIVIPYNIGTDYAAQTTAFASFYQANGFLDYKSSNNTIVFKEILNDNFVTYTSGSKVDVIINYRINRH